jgi:hypothetical protein
MDTQRKCHRCKQWKLAIFDGYQNISNKMVRKYLDSDGNVWLKRTECTPCIQERLEQYKIKLIKRRKKIQGINRKLSHNLRKRLSKVVKRLFKGKSRSSSAAKDLGCSIDELRVHLESKFQSGMNWCNYGKWHIDHIYPLSKADLSDRESLLKVIHYTNLQPLWAKDNLIKGSKIL